ncbi:MAG TPA: hypothetical protein VJC03_06830 [bacterium]|nr:hypothetical protein [bacterium]
MNEKRLACFFLVFFLCGCATRYVVYRNTPPYPAFTVIPDSPEYDDCQFADQISSILI